MPDKAIKLAPDFTVTIDNGKSAIHFVPEGGDRETILEGHVLEQLAEAGCANFMFVRAADGAFRAADLSNLAALVAAGLTDEAHEFFDRLAARRPASAGPGKNLTAGAAPT